MPVKSSGTYCTSETCLRQNLMARNNDSSIRTHTILQQGLSRILVCRQITDCRVPRRQISVEPTVSFQVADCGECAGFRRGEYTMSRVQEEDQISPSDA